MKCYFNRANVIQIFLKLSKHFQPSIKEKDAHCRKQDQLLDWLFDQEIHSLLFIPWNLAFKRHLYYSELTPHTFPLTPAPFRYFGCASIIIRLLSSIVNTRSCQRLVDVCIMAPFLDSNWPHFIELFPPMFLTCWEELFSHCQEVSKTRPHCFCLRLWVISFDSLCC